jgi:hypothetical protein
MQQHIADASTQSEIVNRKSSISKPFCGGTCEGETPVPIPNTEVKTLSPDDTAWATRWESRTPPQILSKRLISPEVSRFVLLKGMTFFYNHYVSGWCEVV